jgi:hypothetical protein
LNAGASADIVLFPGIRYERHPEPNEPKPGKGKPRRDTLQIES